MVLAIGMAIEQETRAVQGLQRENHGPDVKAVIAERVRNIRELNELRRRLARKN